MTRQRGFSLLEMMVVVLLFTLVTGAVFGLLNTAQQRYRAESQVLDSFQGARQAVDQITREIHTAGYPGMGNFPQQCPGGTTIQTGCCATCPPYDPATNNLVATPFLTNANGPGGLGINGCVPGQNCPLPDNFNLIIEEDVDPEVNNGVEWIVYTLRDPNGNPPGPCTAPPPPQTLAAWAAGCPQPNVLWRGVFTKIATGNLDTNANVAFNLAGLNGNVSNAGLIPLVFNVINDPTSNNQPSINLVAENQKLFRYDFDPTAGGTPTAQKIRTVYTNMIVRSQDPDPKTNQYRTVTLRATANRYNN